MVTGLNVIALAATVVGVAAIVIFFLGPRE